MGRTVNSDSTEIGFNEFLSTVKKLSNKQLKITHQVYINLYL